MLWLKAWGAALLAVGVAFFLAELGDKTIAFWADETLPWVQVYTNPTRDAIAVEPMTCGPDAFNEGPTRAGLITLAPGASTRSVWGIRAS